MRKRWLLKKAKRPLCPPDEAQTPNPQLPFTQLWRSANAPAGLEGAGSLCGAVPCRCRVSIKLQKSELLRTPAEPPPPNHHHPQRDAASTWCRCSGLLVGLDWRSFRIKMLWVKARREWGSKYTLSSLIYVVVWSSSSRKSRWGLLCGRGRISFLFL